MLTKNDFDQIRTIVQSETRAIVQSETRIIVREEIKPIKDDIIFLKSAVSKLEHGQEVIINELVGVINMFGEEFDRTHSRLNTIEHRLGILVD